MIVALKTLGIRTKVLVVGLTQVLALANAGLNLMQRPRSVPHCGQTTPPPIPMEDMRLKILRRTCNEAIRMRAEPAKWAAVLDDFSAWRDTVPRIRLKWLAIWIDLDGATDALASVAEPLLPRWTRPIECMVWIGECWRDRRLTPYQELDDRTLRWQSETLKLKLALRL